MKDRNSQYPGRVTLVPVEGQENTYDMTRADEPLDAGTPLSKATLLKDSTAALYGLDENATPNDIFAKIAAKIAFGCYTGDGAEERMIALDETPKAVLVMSARGEVTHYAATSKYESYGGLALAGSDVVASNVTALSVVNGGFKVYRNVLNGPYIRTNETNVTYNYIAFF